MLLAQNPELASVLKPLVQQLLSSVQTTTPEVVTKQAHQVSQQRVIQRKATSRKTAQRKTIQRKTAVNPEPLRRQVHYIIDHSPGYRDEGPALEAIEELVNQADEFAEHGDGDNALLLLEAIVEAYVESWMNLDGSSGESGDFFEELDGSVAMALLNATLTTEQQLVWRNRLDRWQKEVADYGIDHGFACSGLALGQGWDEPELQAVLRGEVTQLSIPSTSSLETLDRKIRNLVGIRLGVLKHREQYEAYLNLAKATGFGRYYLVMLVDLGRFDQAIAQAPQHLSCAYDALMVAEAFRDQGELEFALEIAEAGLPLGGLGGKQLAAWASDLAEGLGNTDKSLDARIQAFRESPSLEDYLKIEELAQEAWPEHRRKLLESLRKRNPHVFGEAMVNIFLHEGLLEAAIKAADEMRSFHAELIHRVMDAAIAHDPDWVIDNACDRAESIMDQGKAHYYHAAIEWLKRARAAYVEMEQQQAWQGYHAELLQKHARKRKLVGLLKWMRRI